MAESGKKYHESGAAKRKKWEEKKQKNELIMFINIMRKIVRGPCGIFSPEPPAL